MKVNGRGRLAALLFAVLFALASSCYPALAEYDAQHPENLREEDLTCQAAILVEANSGTVIFEKNADAMMYPASTTKIMTAYLALTMGDLEGTCTASDVAVNVPSDSSTIGLSAGEEMNLRDLVYATMLTSGNDGANVIAEAVSGSIDNFVALMNRAAGAFGCTATHFANAHGYHDENHYTTARDMALIARAAMKNNEFRNVVSTTTYTFPQSNVSRARNLSTNDSFITPSSDGSVRYYEYGIGVKTGFHSAAGYCFVGAAVKDGVELISVVFNASSDAARYTDTIKLMEYGYTQYISTSIAEIYAMNPKVVDISGFSLEDSQVGKLELSLQRLNTSTGSDQIVTTENDLAYWVQNFNTLTVTEFSREFRAPITQGEVMGTMTYYNDDGTFVEYQLMASRSIAARESLAPTIDEIIQDAENDTNPFPRFTFELFFLYIFLPALGIYLLVKLFRILRHKVHRKTKIRTIKPSERYYR